MAIVLACLVLFGMYYLVAYGILVPQSRQAQANIQHLKNLGQQKKPQTFEEQIQPLLEVIKRKIKMPESARIRIQQKLAEARSKTKPEDFWATQWLFAITTFTLLGLIALFKTSPGFLFFALLSGALMFYVPDLGLQQERDKNRLAMVKSLPDFIGQVLIFRSAGLTTTQAVKCATEYAAEELKPELQRLNAELEVETDDLAALKRFADRTGIVEAQNFVLALAQGLSVDPKQADQLYAQQAQHIRELRKATKKKLIKLRPGKLNAINMVLYANIVLIPLVATIMSTQLMR